MLSALAKTDSLRQKDIVGRTSLSKGTVSNNVRKLEEKNLVEKEEKVMLNVDQLLKTYREHVESFLIRESSDPETLNDLRTHLKKNISEVMESEKVEETLIAVLAEASERQDLISLNSVFKETDRTLSNIGTKEKLIGLATDKRTVLVDGEKLSEEAEKVLEEVKE